MGSLLICEAIVTHDDVVAAFTGVAATSVASALPFAPTTYEDGPLVNPIKPLDALATTAPRIIPDLLAPIGLVDRSLVFRRRFRCPGEGRYIAYCPPSAFIFNSNYNAKQLDSPNDPGPLPALPPGLKGRRQRRQLDLPYLELITGNPKMVACALAVGLFFLAGIGAGALGHAGFRALQEKRRVKAWRWGQGRAGGLRGARNRYQPIRHSQHNPGWRVASTHSPTPSTQGAPEWPLPDIVVDNYNEELSPTRSEDGGWLQL